MKLGKENIGSKLNYSLRRSCSCAYATMIKRKLPYFNKLSASMLLMLRWSFCSRTSKNSMKLCMRLLLAIANRTFWLNVTVRFIFYLTSNCTKKWSRKDFLSNFKNNSKIKKKFMCLELVWTKRGVRLDSFGKELQN